MKTAELFPMGESDRPQASLLIECASCGAPPGYYCATRTGRRAAQAHRVRRVALDSIRRELWTAAVRSVGARLEAQLADLPPRPRRRSTNVTGPTLERLLGANPLEHPPDRAPGEVHRETAHDHPDERSDQRHDPTLPASRKLELG